MKGRNHLLGLLPTTGGLLIGACLVYCAVWWFPHSMTIVDPDCSITCWAYCATQSPFWGTLTGMLAAGLCFGGILILLRKEYGIETSLVLGILTLPTGLLAVVPFAFNRWSLSHKEA
mgnify:CR=1 FL=1